MEDQAAKLYEAGKVEQAIALLASKLQNDMQHVEWFLQLASYLVASDQLTFAEELLLKAKNIFGDLEEINYNLAVIYFQAGKFELATDYLKKLSSSKLAGDAFYMLAQISQQQNKLSEALVYALTAVDENPDLIDNQLLAGDLLLQMQEFSQAQQYYQNAADLKNTSDGYFKLALTQMVLDNGDYQANFSRSRQLDAQYFKEHQQQLIDIERYLQNNSKEDF